MSFFKFLRITILLTVLVIVAGNQWLTQSRISSWEKPIWMTVYPVLAGEASTTTGSDGSRACLDCPLESQNALVGMAA